jgi:L-2,4-diaminobutyrate decarboxylase
LELLAPAVTNTVALRWTVPGLALDRRDRVNEEIRARMSREGRALVGRTQDGAGVALKLTFVNPLCTPAQARRLVTELAGQGRRLAEQIDVTVGRTA